MKNIPDAQVFMCQLFWSKTFPVAKKSLKLLLSVQFGRQKSVVAKFFQLEMAWETQTTFSLQQTENIVFHWLAVKIKRLSYVEKKKVRICLLWIIILILIKYQWQHFCWSQVWSRVYFPLLESVFPSSCFKVSTFLLLSATLWQLFGVIPTCPWPPGK